MKTRLDRRFRDELDRLRFRFACEDCAHFDEPHALCSLGFPPAPRRRELEGTSLELCKSYELT